MTRIYAWHNEIYGADSFDIWAPVDGRAIEVKKNGERQGWANVPYAIRCFIFKSIDANGRAMEQHPFPSPRA